MPRPILDVVQQHAEEASILFLRRDRAVGQPHYKLADLVRLDDQLDAHLDGLRIAGAAGWDAAMAELERWCEPGEAFAAGVLAFESGDWKRISQVVAMARNSAACAGALGSALAWLPPDAAGVALKSFTVRGDAVLRRIALAGSLTLGRDPGETLDAVIESDDSQLRALGLWAVGKFGRIDRLARARRELASPELEVRVAAAWSMARLTADGQSIEILQQAAESGNRDALPALQMALRRLPVQQAVAWLNELVHKEEVEAGARCRLAVIGTGVMGLSDSVPWLLELMQGPALARIAGEAFCTITGADMAYEKLEGARPAGFRAGPSEDPADPNVAMDDDENLLWPDAEKLGRWWQRRQGAFESGVRHLCGRRLTDDWLATVLRQGYQRHRLAAALELALRRPTQPMFDACAKGRFQQELLRVR